MFVDRVTIHVKAGDGGAGSAAMLREPFRPRGGPDGGDGGRGGDVILQVDPSVFDLAALADHPHARARPGRPGGRANRHGAHGEDLVLPVPDGTVVHDERGLVADLVGPDVSAVVARGGRGGRGNLSLAGPRNRLPRGAEPGEPGEVHRLGLELRLVADVGLVGLPNAGKSTLLARLTAARPKIADYPFTTLVPNLGVTGGDGDRVVVADVPGLIEGAHQGKGLGLEFLRHVSRCRVLVFVLDLTGDLDAALQAVRAELGAFDATLLDRRALVVGTKADLVPGAAGAPPGRVDLVVSGVTGEGVEELLQRVGAEVAVARAEEPARSSYVVVRPARESFVVTREGERFRVSGGRIERWVAEVDLDDPAQVKALQRRLIRAGVERRLAEAGARRGDEVAIGSAAFEFIPDDGGGAVETGVGDTGADVDQA